MSSNEYHLPEDLIIAVMHKVGKDIRIFEDFTFARIFNDAAINVGGSFSQFKWHPQYHFSELLTDTIQILDHAGSIIRENAAQMYFKPSPHTLGPYGKRIYEELDDIEKKAVEIITQELKNHYGKKAKS